MSSLTGRRRYRLEPKHWFREPMVVLQVEETRLITYWSGGMIDTERYEVWRDARVSDLTEHEAPK